MHIVICILLGSVILRLRVGCARFRAVPAQDLLLCALFHETHHRRHHCSDLRDRELRLFLYGFRSSTQLATVGTRTTCTVALAWRSWTPRSCLVPRGALTAQLTQAGEKRKLPTARLLILVSYRAQIRIGLLPHHHSRLRSDRLLSVSRGGGGGVFRFLLAGRTSGRLAFATAPVGSLCTCTPRTSSLGPCVMACPRHS